MKFIEFYKRARWEIEADRIGPDIPFTHWRLFLPTLMAKLCYQKFKEFGEGSSFRPHAYAVNCSRISIGRNVVIRPQTILIADDSSKEGIGIIIEDDVLIGSGVHVYTTNHNFADPNSPIIYQGDKAEKQVVIQRGCWIGAGAIVLPGVRIGENAVVGAGSVVTRDVRKGSVVAGAPAKEIEKKTKHI